MQVTVDPRPWTVQFLIAVQYSHLLLNWDRTSWTPGEPWMQRPPDQRDAPTTADAPTMGIADVHPEIPGYALIGVLGVGGMGRVYLAEDVTLGRRVAVKVILERLEENVEVHSRFLREARIMATLEHPNIVRIYAFGTAAGHDYLVMELIEGESLQARIRRSGPMDPPAAQAYLRQAVRALGAAFEHGIIHRDVKPSNIMIGKGDNLHLADFGLARTMDVGAKALTDSTKIVGTPQYMAPEVARGAGEDERSDIYSLGVVLFEMLTGKRPFDGETPYEVIDQHLHQPLPSLIQLRPELPHSFQELCESMTAKDPSQRPSSYADLERLITDAIVETSDQQRPTYRSIAVLPFADMSPGRDQEYFCDGLAEELINALTRNRELRVASRTSSFRFKDRAEDIREIGRCLTVDTVLEGSVRKAGDMLRVTAQLIDICDGFHLWSERYDRRLEDVFAIQDEITNSIVGELETTFSGEARQLIECCRTSDITAYDLYLKGRKYMEELTGRSLDFARQMFLKAAEVDPTYALAQAGIAEACCYLHIYAEPNQQNLQQADKASRRAIELGPNLTEAHVALGLTLALQGHHEESDEHFERGLRIDPQSYDAHYLFGRMSFAQGEMNRAARCFEKALELRPESIGALQILQMVYERLGRQPEAERAARRSLALIDKHLDLNPDDARALYTGAQNALRIGDRERGMQWGRRVLALGRDDPSILYNVACIHALAGDTDTALDHLEAAISKGFAHRDWITQDPDLDTIRDHPRLGTLLDRIQTD